MVKSGCYKDRCTQPVIGLVVLIPANAGKDAFTVEACEEHATAREKRGHEIIRNKPRRQIEDGNDRTDGNE